MQSSSHTNSEVMLLIPSSNDDDETNLRPKEDIFAFAERQYSGSMDERSRSVIEIETKQRVGSVH